MNASRRELLRVAAGAVAGCWISRQCFAIARPTSNASSMFGDPDDRNDRRQDMAYLQHSILHIDDGELFRSIDLSRPELTAVRRAAQAADYAAAYRAWGEFWSRVASSRGLFIGDGELLMTADEAAASLREKQRDILVAADKILAHEITGWGDVTIRSGKVVDFTADYGRNGVYGFHYWGWARPLISAFLLTRDEKYLAEFDALFNSWYEQRDKVHGQIPDLHPIWYELGLGLRNRIFLEYYCLPLASQSVQTHERILKTVLGAARWLFQEENRKYRGGNWQIMGSYGLAQIALIVPEFSESNPWVQLGAKRVVEHVAQDFYADGCHSERVPSSYMLIGYRDPRNLARLMMNRPPAEAGGPAKDQYAKLTEPLQRTLNWYLLTLAPDGFLPGINDGSRQRMPAALFRDGVRFFGRQDMAWAAQNLLGVDLGGEGKEPAQLSVYFPASGFTAMRSDWSPGARYMLINHGPSGGGHSHADSLDFSLHAFGQAMAIDSGIGYTYDDPNQGPWYIRTRAHNCLTVDDQDLNRTHAEARDVAWTSLKRLDYFAATHYGYLERLGVKHRRHIAFVKPDYWLVYDIAEGRAGGGEHKLAWNLHTPVKMTTYESGFATEVGPGLIVLPTAKDWTPRQAKGIASVRGIRGYDKDYAEIDWLIFDGVLHNGMPATLGVLLLPFEKQRPDVKFRMIKQDRVAAHFAIERGETTDHVVFGEPGATLSSGDIRFSGGCAVLRSMRDKLTSFAAAKALTLNVGDRALITTNVLVDREGDV